MVHMSASSSAVVEQVFLFCEPVVPPALTRSWFSNKSSAALPTGWFIIIEAGTCPRRALRVVMPVMTCLDVVIGDTQH